MLKVPLALRARNYGGANTGQQMRKENFHYLAPRFLLDVAEQLHLHGEIHKVPGKRSESGVVELVAPQATLRLHEDAADRSGLVLEFIPVDGEPPPVCELANVAKDIEVNDWIVKVGRSCDLTSSQLN